MVKEKGPFCKFAPSFFLCCKFSFIPPLPLEDVWEGWQTFLSFSPIFCTKISIKESGLYLKQKYFQNKIERMGRGYGEKWISQKIYRLIGDNIIWFSLSLSWRTHNALGVSIQSYSSMASCFASCNNNNSRQEFVKG